MSEKIKIKSNQFYLIKSLNVSTALKQRVPTGRINGVNLFFVFSIGRWFCDKPFNYNIKQFNDV